MALPLGETLKSVWSQLIADKRRRYLLIGGAVLLLLGLVYRLYPLYEGENGREEEIAVLKERVAKYRQAVNGRGGLETRLALLKKSLEQAEEGLLTGKTAALAAVEVQNSLNEIALAGGVEIKSMQVLKPQEQKQEEGFYTTVPVRFGVTMTTRQLKDFLYRIETFPKFFLSVQEIRISAVGAREARQIRCDMTVAGVMRNIKE